MKTSKKSLVKSGHGGLKNPSLSLEKTTTKPLGMPRKSPSGQIIGPGSCSSVGSVPNCAASKSGSCRKFSSKPSATKMPFRSDDSNWFITVLELPKGRSINSPVGFKACHVDKRTFFGVSKTRSCEHLHVTYKEALECSLRMREEK